MLARLFKTIHSATRRRRLVGPALCAVVIALLCTAGVRAHEIGTTHVAVIFQEDRTYDVEVVTDAAALVDKLEASAGASLPADTSSAHLESLLPGFDEAFRQRVKLSFDDSEVRPLISYSVAPGSDVASPPVATIRLTGQIPQDARHFTWTYGWTFASYALTVRTAASEPAATAWLEGGQTSTPFELTAPPPPVDRVDTALRYLTLGFTHIVPYGLDHML